MSINERFSDAGAVKSGERAPGRAGRERSSTPFVLAAALALIGLADAMYLTAQHLAGHSVRCTVTTGCDEVLASTYAVLPGGIPLAALGALAYFAAFGLATLAAFGHVRARPLLTILVALMFAMTLWLLFVQAFVLGKFCEFCLLSAAVTISLSVLMFIAWRAPQR